LLAVAWLAKSALAVMILLLLVVAETRVASVGRATSILASADDKLKLISLSDASLLPFRVASRSYLSNASR
jgi:hypothetical protein